MLLPDEQVQARKEPEQVPLAWPPLQEPVLLQV